MCPFSRARLKLCRLRSVVCHVQRKRTLRQLIADSIYLVEPERIAEAILLRARTRAAVPEVSFRNGDRDVRVRSFRLTNDVPSFHLTGLPRRQPHRLNLWPQTRGRSRVS